MKDPKNNICVPIIGYLKTPHSIIENMPIQPVGAKGVEGKVVLSHAFKDGLRDIEGFSHIILMYQFHEVQDYSLSVQPFMDDKEHGIFATRSPKRPSKIGMSIVRLIHVEENVLTFEGADMLNNSPLIDIKPFFRQTDNRPNAVSGWLDEKAHNMAEITQSDDRFK